MDLTNQIMDRVQYIASHLGQKAALLVAEQKDVINRDFEATIKSFNEPPESIIEGGAILLFDQEKHNRIKQDYITTVLDAHVDTLIKTILNLIVSAMTEEALKKLDINWEGIDLIEYALANRERYGIE